MENTVSGWVVTSTKMKTKSGDPVVYWATFSPKRSTAKTRFMKNQVHEWPKLKRDFGLQITRAQLTIKVIYP